MTPVRLVTGNEEASAACADILREALAEAEAGRVTGLFLVTRSPDREMVGAWQFGSDFVGLLGCVELSKRDMIESASEE